MRIFNLVSVSILSIAAIACEDASLVLPTTTGTGGAGGSGGSSDGGSGGMDVGGAGGSSDGGSGGEGGSGGAPQAGPCDTNADGVVGVIFTAPAENQPNLVGIGGWVECPGANGPACTSTAWTKYVAPQGDVATALIGERPAGTKFHLIAGLYVAVDADAYYWFVENDNQVYKPLGTYDVCVGKTRCGGHNETDGYDGCMGPTDEANYPANSMVTVPMPQ